MRSRLTPGARTADSPCQVPSKLLTKDADEAVGSKKLQICQTVGFAVTCVGGRGGGGEISFQPGGWSALEASGADLRGEAAKA